MSFGNAVEKAVDFIVAAQQQGQWEDYDLPVGVSTEWVTGFIGWTLADVGIHSRLAGRNCCDGICLADVYNKLPLRGRHELRIKKEKESIQSLSAAVVG